MSGGDRSQYHIRAVARACDLLDLLRESDHAVSLPEAAEATGLPKSSAYRYLTTLEDHHYAVRDPESGAYLPVYHSQAQDLDALRAVARPYLAALRDRLGETVVLAILNIDRPLNLEIAEAATALRVHLPEGRPEHLAATALGKALLSQLPDSEVPSGALTLEIQAVRWRGWVFVAGDTAPDVNAVSVRLPAGLPAAIGVVAPASRMPEVSAAEVAGILGETVRLLTAQL